MEKITTAGGRTFNVDMVASIPDPPCVYIRIVNSNIDTVRSVFSDPAETVLLQYGSTIISNYTHVGYIIQEDIAVKVRLDL